MLMTINIRLLTVFFFFNDTATTEIYPLSLHDALPICRSTAASQPTAVEPGGTTRSRSAGQASHARALRTRSEEHTSELQSQSNLVCRLLLEKKNKSTCSLLVLRPLRPDRTVSCACVCL